MRISQIKLIHIKHSSWNIVNEIIEDNSLTIKQNDNNKEKIRDLLKNLSAEDFFKYYTQRSSTRTYLF